MKFFPTTMQGKNTTSLGTSLKGGSSSAGGGGPNNWHQQHAEFHRRAWEQHQRNSENARQRRAQDALAARHRRAQDRVLWVNSLSHLRNVAIDEDTGRVDKNFLLALYHHGPNCERVLMGDMVFPFPFAHNSDDLGIWWEDVLQTAKALGTEQGRPEASPSDIAQKFGVKMGPGDGPTLLYWKKGARLSKPEVVSGLKTNNDFQNWFWERLKVVARFVNNHTHDVQVFWMQGKEAKSDWVLKAGASERRQVHSRPHQPPPLFFLVVHGWIVLGLCHRMAAAELPGHKMDHRYLDTFLCGYIPSFEPLAL